jgi:hypothetical protein
MIIVGNLTSLSILIFCENLELVKLGKPPVAFV